MQRQEWYAVLLMVCYRMMLYYYKAMPGHCRKHTSVGDIVHGPPSSNMVCAYDITYTCSCRLVVEYRSRELGMCSKLYCRLAANQLWVACLWPVDARLWHRLALPCPSCGVLTAMCCAAVLCACVASDQA